MSQVFSLDEHVRALAKRIGKDVGSLPNLTTLEKTSLVKSINSIKSDTDSMKQTLASKTDLAPLATKVELSQAVQNIIGGAATDSDSLKELADKIVALAQADQGLVSALAVQGFTDAQKQVARDNIGAVTMAQVQLLAATTGYLADYEQASTTV